MKNLQVNRVIIPFVRLKRLVFVTGVMTCCLVSESFGQVWLSGQPSNSIYTNNIVGIGTDAPLHRLHIVGDQLTRGRMESDSLRVHHYSRLFGPVRVGQHFLLNGDQGTFTSGTGSIHFPLTSLTTTERIGIGTTNPQAPLHVVGDIKAQGANFDLLKIGSSIRMGETDPNTNNDHTIFSDDGDLLINTHPDSDGFHTILNAGSNNNVGIGVLNPSEKLHVGGGNVRFDNLGGTGTVLVEAGNDGILSAKGYSNDAADVLRGDGTWGPSPLAGTVWELTGNAGTNPLLHFIGTTDAQDLTFRTNNAERMRITQDGMVGIGRDNPLAPLHVTGSALISKRTGIGVNNPQRMLHVKTTHHPVIEVGPGGFSLDTMENFFEEVFGEAAALVDGAVVDSGGNVIATVDTTSGEIRSAGDTLIGVIEGSPADQSHSSHYGLRLEDAFSSTLKVDGQPSSVVKSIWDIWPHGESGKMHVSNPQTEDTVITINDAGNVGIGMTNPQNTLTLYNDFAELGFLPTNMIQFTNSGTGTGASDGLLFGLSGGAGIMRNIGPLIFVTGQSPAERVRITGDGKVAIGTNHLPEGYRLYVKDGILAEKIKSAVHSSTDWSDDVFDKDYDLQHLDEVERFIEANKHLPDVPSAEEVVENGVDMVEISATLLRKVEELTLYTIEQEKRIKALEEKLEEEQASDNH